MNICKFAEENKKLRELLRTFGSFNPDSLIQHPAWVNVHGIVYKVTGVVVTGVNGGMPTFGKITDVVIVNEFSVLLFVNLLKTKYLDMHCFVYVVEYLADE